MVFFKPFMLAADSGRSFEVSCRTPCHVRYGAHRARVAYNSATQNLFFACHTLSSIFLSLPVPYPAKVRGEHRISKEHLLPTLNRGRGKSLIVGQIQLF